MQVCFLPDNVTVEAEVGEPILQVADRAGLSIPTGCLMGSCHACEVEIESGDTICACISSVPAGCDRLTINLCGSNVVNPPLHQVAIALGSNLGDSYTILESALKTLSQTSGLVLQAQSPIYRTIAVGPPQPDYLNACALFATSLDPAQFLEVLLKTEAQFGRVRREKWGARLLDLDLLLFDDLIVEQPHLQIPHPHMTERAFVLVPLNDIIPNWIEPISGKSIAALMQQVDCSGVTKF